MDDELKPEDKHMHELEQLTVLNLYCKFLRENVMFEGEPELVDEKIRELAWGLYGIFRKLKVDFPVKDY